MKGSENPFPSVNMEEIASDGSTLANADADTVACSSAKTGCCMSRTAPGR